MRQASIVSIHEKDPHGLDNVHIQHGYRKNFDTLGKIMRSIFMLHNETVNIWTHLLGGILFIIFACSLAYYLEPVFENQVFMKLRQQVSSTILRIRCDITFPTIDRSPASPL